VLGTTATAADIAAWQAYLSGTSRAGVVALFLSSTPAYQRAVVGFMAAFWNISLDTTDEATYVADLAGGETLEEVAASLAASPIYVGRADEAVG
jgi:hypothetical protein